MEAQFWHERWELKQTGFHQSQVNPMLSEYGRGILANGGEGPVFVPLCGKSLDMVWLRLQGYPVLGVELSPIAIEDFFTEQSLSPTRSSLDEFQCHESEGIRLLVGDFFDLKPAHLEGVQAVYDRAALIALPQELQSRYAEHLLRLLPKRPPILLVTLEYEQTEMEGPPFSTTEDRVRELFGVAYQVENLSARDTREENPGLKSRGLTWLTEKAYYLHVNS
ncbi:MAG: thiopurine S-methyltransferase [Methylococcaceae bacterium]|nr:thiopurine S-methyltransferase [Methylococcaceae bacterium]